MPQPRLLSQTQINIFLAFMEKHRDLATASYASYASNSMSESREGMNRLWDELATQINAAPGKTKRSGRAWRRFWNEKKYSVRKKLADFKSAQKSGKPFRSRLTEDDYRIMNLLSLQTKCEPAEEPTVDDDSSLSSPSDLFGDSDKTQKERSEDTPQTVIQRVMVLKPEISDYIQSDNEIEGCDEGYSPGSAINLPRVDAFAVSEFIAASPDIDKEQSRKIWRQPREELNDSIGYVQIKRETIICTVKCVIATKTTAYNCTIAYNEANDWVVAVFCDGCETLCHHGVTGLVWLCSHDRRPGSYWMEPLITMDGKSLRISEIYGFTKPSYPTLNTVMDEFIRIAQEKKILNPALMYLYQDVKTEAALHKLMCQFKRKFNTMDSGHFMEFCRKNINEGNIAKLEPMSPEERYALEYGRITDALLHDVCQNDDVEGLIRKITFPDVQENVEATPFLIESLERALKMKIKKCGILILPIFAASPYGTTDTHVVHIQYSKSTGINEQNLSPKDNASLQLQMFLAKKENACLCTVYENNKINVTIVKFNQMRVAHMLAKATVFWQTRIFRQIVMDN